MGALVVMSKFILGPKLLDQPGQFVALARGAFDLHGEATGEVSRDISFDAADIVEIDDCAVADLRRMGRYEHRLIRGHLDRLAGNFELVRQHAAPEESYGRGWIGAMMG